MTSGANGSKQFLAFIILGASPTIAGSRSPSGPLGLALNAISPSYKGVSYELTTFVHFGSTDFFRII